MRKLKRDKNNYSEEYVKKHRTFPAANTVWLVILILLQIALVAFAVLYEPKPQDVIKEYTVTVEPRKDGKLDIEYDFLWEAIDTSEPLTWVEIGMANQHFTVDESSLSGNIASYKKNVNGDYVTLRLDFRKSYIGGNVFSFSFKVTQDNMLCSTTGGYFYEFVPGWFNATPVEKYEFRWKQSEGCLSADNARLKNGYYTWSGSFECGGYERMYVSYAPETFEGMKTVKHVPFDDGGTCNELKEGKIAVIVVVCIILCVTIIAQVYIIDSYVSYDRGRGFLTGYGYRVHVYGRTNPHYRRASQAASSSGRGGRSGGGGCACACACACAGGGRAGCSEKDTYTNVFDKEKSC